MSVRFMSWNLRGAWRGGVRLQTQAQIAFVRTVEVDVLAAQEVTPEAFELISACGMFHSAAFSLNEGHLGETRCEYGSALFFSKRIDLIDFRRLTQSELSDVPGDIRNISRDLTAISTASVETLRLTFGSFHVPAAQGTRWGWRGKRGVLRGIANVLATSSAGAVGVDANGPKSEHRDVRRNVYWYEGTAQDREEYLLHDPERAPHGYRDALRVYLELHPEEHHRRPRESAHAPLAVSHRRRGVPCRYDFVFVAGLIPLDAPAYPEVTGLSDHSPVVANLSLPPVANRG